MLPKCRGEASSLVPDREHSGKPRETRTLDVAERVRLMRDGLVNNSAFFISSLVGMALVPVLWKGLGGEMYGLWIAVLSVNGLVGLLDFDLKASVTREVAAAGSQAETIRFVGSAYHAYVIVGVIGGLLISTLGLPLSGALHLSAEGRRVAPFLFSLAGVAFAADQLLLFTTAVLNGLRSFHIVNLISTGGVLLRAAGIVILMLAGEDLISVAIWNALSSAVTAFAAFAVVGRREPQYRFGDSPLEWRTLRGHLRFSLESWVTSLAITGIWETSSLMVGMIRGSAWIAPFHIGQKLPLAVSRILSRVAQVLFPSASHYQRRQDGPAAFELLEAGTRWLLLLALPICLLLWILAPNILEAWIGQAPADVLLVFRLTTGAVLAASVAVSAEQVLWGTGQVRKVLLVYVMVLVGSVALSLWLLSRIGIAGAAWGLFLPVALEAVALVEVASRANGMRMTKLVGQVLAGLPLPTLVCVVSASSLLYLADPQSWGGVIGTVLAASTAYCSVLYYGGAREEERALVRRGFSLLDPRSHPVYRKLRTRLSRIECLRNTWYLIFALWDFLQDPWQNASKFDREFESRADPWGYARQPEQARHRLAVEMLDSARNEGRFGRALEIGCAEGTFTELLEARSATLLAVDFSSVALARARGRRLWADKVQFAAWDLRRDPVPGTFQLVIAMDVLAYFFRPRALRAACAKLVEAVVTNGYLLVGVERQNPLFETSWWGSLLCRGGKQITATMARHPSLSVVATETTDTHVLTLFRKVV